MHTKAFDNNNQRFMQITWQDAETYFALSLFTTDVQSWRTFSWSNGNLSWENSWASLRRSRAYIWQPSFSSSSQDRSTISWLQGRRPFFWAWLAQYGISSEKGKTTDPSTFCFRSGFWPLRSLDSGRLQRSGTGSPPSLCFFLCLFFISYPLCLSVPL